MEYIGLGLDMSMEEIAVYVRRNGKRVRRGKCAYDPKTVAALQRSHARALKRVAFETGRCRCGSFTR